MWFCTADGLSRFDGYTFTTYTTDQGIPSGRVSDLLETRDGRYWLATNVGLVRFNPSGPPLFTLVAMDDADPAAKNVTSLVEDRAGTIWVGTTNGLYRLERSRGTLALRAVDIGIPHEYREQATISHVAGARDGSLWIGTPSGLYRRWPDGSAARYTQRHGLPDDFIHHVIEDHLGRLWVATRSRGFFGLTADDSHKPPIISRAYTMSDGLPTQWIFGLFESSDHQLWLATNTGLVQFLPDADAPRSAFRAYSPKEGLSYREITALNQDASGNLWLGTNAAGAMKLARNGFTTYGEPDGPASVNAIVEDRSGALCFRGAGRESGMYTTMFGCFDGRRVTWFTPRAIQNLGWVEEGVLLQTRNREWWLGATTGVYRFPSSTSFLEIRRARALAHYTTHDGLAAAQVFRLFEDSGGDVWISTISSSVNGLALWDHATGRLRNLAGLAGLPSLDQELPRAFGEDRFGSVWIGFNNGAARYRAGRLRFFTTGDGLPPGSIVNIHSDGAGRLWLASSRSGVVRIDDPAAERPRFTTYSTEQGLASNRAEVITDDAYGRIYIGTGRGLDRLDPVSGRIGHFTSADGLAPGLFRAAFRDRAGTLWFGMTGGLSRLTPGPEAHRVAPPILVSRLTVAGSPRPVSALGERAMTLPDLASDQNQLQIEFLGLDFTPGERLRYQYRLDGADADWSAPNEGLAVNYANLAPGRYRFLVRGVAADGTTSAPPATLAFVVLRPVWQRWWFVTLIAAVAGIAAYVAYRIRMAQIVEMASVRTRIATDLHDDIGSNLTRIAILSEVARQQLPDRAAPADGLLSSIASISRDSIAAMSDIVWAVNPERDRLADLVRRMRRHAEELFATRGVALTFRAPAEDLTLGAAVRRDVFLIFKEAVNNAARHADCSSVSVDFAIDGRWLSLDIADDGRGFDPATAENTGQGLASMRRRAERLRGILDVEAAVDKGTIVRARIPAASGVRAPAIPR